MLYYTKNGTQLYSFTVPLLFCSIFGNLALIYCHIPFNRLIKSCVKPKLWYSCLARPVTDSNLCGHYLLMMWFLRQPLVKSKEQKSKVNTCLPIYHLKIIFSSHQYKKKLSAVASQTPFLRFCFASGSPDNIKIWKLPDGNFLQNFTGHQSIVNTLAINSDGVLVSGGMYVCVNYEIERQKHKKQVTIYIHTRVLYVYLQRHCWITYASYEDLRDINVTHWLHT